MRIFAVVFLVFVTSLVFAQEKSFLKEGDKAPDFTLKTVDNKNVTLSDLYANGPVVLVVLRGWPGYQCPICTRQVGELFGESERFKKAGTKVLMVYPGPAEALVEHAKEFSEDFQFPENYYFTMDPDYSMVNKYALRWDEPKETAYPSTFVIDKKGKITFVKISTTHGGRSTPDEIFSALAASL